MASIPNAFSVLAVAGLVCAAELASSGVQVSVFDMGRGPGGRMSQRRYNPYNSLPSLWGSAQRSKI